MSSTPIERPSVEVPKKARVVVVGGGIIGCSVAYHLAKLGWSDVVLLERDGLTSGTTWHAAGLMVTFGSLSETSTELRKYTKDLYSNLEAETGQSTGFKPCGFIELATNKDYLEEYRRTSAFNRTMGVDVHEISANEVKELFPLCKTDDVLAGFYVPTDGRVNPVDSAMALAKGARMHGAKVMENVTVTGVTKDTSGRKVTGVTTAVTREDGSVAKAHVEAEYVVNCAGMWARQFGEMAGVNVPNQAAEHYYLVTDAMDGVDPNWPVVEDPSSHTYIRPEGAGLLVGLFEPDAAAWNVDKIPHDFSFGEIEPDWERMAPFLETAMNRVPDTLNAGMKTFFCGPESFTPDLAPIVGEAPELDNYFVAAGLNSIGILTGGGIGRLVANWIMTGKPDMDVTGMNIDRLHRYQSNREYRAARVVESLGRVYKCHYPHYPMKTARGCKQTPLYSRLEAKNAMFRDVSGWECADWYAPDGTTPQVGELSWGKHEWFDIWRAEHDACRNGAALIDMSFMSKFRVQGADAGALLNWLSTANVDPVDEAEVITYTQWCNDDGKLEADLTVTKMGENDFMVIATDTMHRHVEAWMNRHIRGSKADGRFQNVTVTDVSGAYAQLNVQGPRSREILQQVTTQDMSDEAFPFRTAREIDIGFGRVLCTRITYVGELGYELFIPTEQAVHVYDRLAGFTEGADACLTHVGLKALGSLRLEKGYRDYGHDMDNTDSLIQSGLGFTCDFEKPNGFLGKEKVQAEKAAGVKQLPKRLCSVLLKDPAAMLYHGEIVYRDGQVVGDVRAGSYGHTLGGAVGLTMIEPQKSSSEHVPITKAYIREGTWEVDVAGVRYPAEVSLTPMYDPKNLRIKG